MRWSTLGLVGAAAMFAATSADAFDVAALVRVGGQDVKGENITPSIGGADAIVCRQLDFAVRGAGAERRYETIRCVKSIDRTSPILFKALASGQEVEATFKFYRPSPVGDGTTQHFYTMQIRGGRVEGVRLATGTGGSQQQVPALEEVSFSFRTIAFTYPPTGAAANDTLTAAPTTNATPLLRP